MNKIVTRNTPFYKLNLRKMVETSKLAQEDHSASKDNWSDDSSERDPYEYFKKIGCPKYIVAPMVD